MNRISLVIAILTLLVLSTTFTIFLAHYESGVRSDARSHIANLLEPQWVTFSHAWERRILLLEGLRGFAESNFEGSLQEMDEKYARFAAALHRQVEGGCCLSIAPGGTVAFVYPRPGNEMYIGHNFLGDRRPGAGAAVTKALATGKIVVAGPYAQAPEGPLAFEAFGAVHGNDGFWGIVSSAIEVLPLLKLSGFEELSRQLALAFRSSDGKVFWGDPAVFKSDPVARQLESFGQTLEVGALPREGWRAFVQPKYTAVRAVGLLGIFFMTGAVYLFARRNPYLVRQVERKSTAAELTTSRVLADNLEDNADPRQEHEEKEKLESQLIQARKMESIGRLAGGVAHDFNNMLSVILGCTELIKARAVLDGPSSGYLQEIIKAANRSRDITRQLLAFSRKQIIAPRILQLNDHINETRKILARMIGEDLHLRFHPGDNLWKIRLDPFQLDQILMNLAVNARDAMPDGGTLAMKTANVTIDTEYLQKHYYLIPGEYVLLELTDEGAGMDQETISHLFEPFFTTKKLGQGTGLGLATVYGIVKQNNGFINVYSEPGGGTCFRVYFPRTHVEEIAPLSEKDQRTEASGTVLLVEDSLQVWELVAGILEEIGFTVLGAKTPSEALSLCGNPDIPIDILVTDVVMPKMNGSELANQVAAMRPGIKILFMSGYPEDFIAHRGILKKGVHFIQKPFSMKDIADTIHQLSSEIPLDS